MQPFYPGRCHALPLDVLHYIHVEKRFTAALRAKDALEVYRRVSYALPNLEIGDCWDLLALPEQLQAACLPLPPALLGLLDTAQALLFAETSAGLFPLSLDYANGTLSDPSLQALAGPEPTLRLACRALNPLTLYLLRPPTPPLELAATTILTEDGVPLSLSLRISHASASPRPWQAGMPFASASRRPSSPLLRASMNCSACLSCATSICLNISCAPLVPPCAACAGAPSSVMRSASVRPLRLA